ncbi:MAG TPA: EthD family reductase [Roseiarcus sp.]|jgi:uncharacterized protein (TIGR02118 family)|nr:EthD family reductase [Roseiarcus sp.]
MAAVVAVYKTPKSAEAFNAYYFSKHVPIAKAMPGLRRYRASDGAVGLPVEPGGVHLIAILEFDSVEAIRNALASPEGQATVADLKNFADGGVDVITFDTKDV